jgi:hypothetical protein
MFRSAIAVPALFVWVLTGSTAMAQAISGPADSPYLTRAITPAGGGDSIGTVSVIDNPAGPDDTFMSVTLDPNTRYAFFLAQSPAGGALPVHLLGEFTTDRDGRGFLAAQLEVVDAFDAANPSQEVNGVAEAGAPGAIANGGIQIPMDFLRIYRANGSLSVFSGGPAGATGGRFVAGTTIPLTNSRGSFTLVDASTDLDIQRLNDGDAIVLSGLPMQLAIRYDTEDAATESVLFSLDNGAVIQPENNAPFAFGGDNPLGDFGAIPNFPGPGIHTLSVTRFTADDAQGMILGTFTIRFDIRP